MGRRSKSEANKWYENSPLAHERTKNAKLTGALHRVCGLLGCEADIDALGEWCKNEEKRRRENHERQIA